MQIRLRSNDMLWPMEKPADSRNGAIVVFGSAGALGGAILRRLTEDQPEASAWIVYRTDAEPAEALARSVPGTRAAQCDLRRPEDLARLAAEVRSSSGYVRTLVHAAVEINVGPLLELGFEAVSAVVHSSGLSLLGVTAAFDDLLQPDSTIIYTTSIGSYRVMPTYGAIGTAKAVGESLVRYLGTELAPRGIRVNAISPGPFVSKAAARVVGDTEVLMRATDAAMPRGRRLDFAEIADLVAYLAGPRSSGITGQVITVDGGLFHHWQL
jgi:enoyl-[acyl-carrier-protein] reductase (NADH)